MVEPSGTHAEISACEKPNTSEFEEQDDEKLGEQIGTYRPHIQGDEQEEFFFEKVAMRCTFCHM